VRLQAENWAYWRPQLVVAECSYGSQLITGSRHHWKISEKQQRQRMLYMRILNHQRLNLTLTLTLTATPTQTIPTTKQFWVVGHTPNNNNKCNNYDKMPKIPCVAWARTYSFTLNEYSRAAKIRRCRSIGGAVLQKGEIDGKHIQRRALAIKWLP